MPEFRNFVVFAIILSFLLPISAFGQANEGQNGKNDANPLQNSGFEQGLENWSLMLDKDYAAIKVVDDLTAPDGQKVLLISHQRTRDSRAIQDLTLKPNTIYLLSFWIRGEHYLRTGYGMCVRTWIGNSPFGPSLTEPALTEDWRMQRFAFVTDDSGKVSLQLHLTLAVGDVYLDNLRIMETTETDARRILGSTPAVPWVPLGPDRAECRVTFGEIYISDKIPSNVPLWVRVNLDKDLWENTGTVKLELPDNIEVTNFSGKTEDVGDGYRRYTLEAKNKSYITSANIYIYDNLVLILSKSADQQHLPARSWVEWQGGKQEPIETKILYVVVATTKQPQNIVTGADSYTNTPGLYPDYFAMMKSMGFNTVDFWKLGGGSEFIPEYRKHNIDVDTEHSGFTEREMMKVLAQVPEAQSVAFGDRERPDIICASHRGELFDKFLLDMDMLASKGFSCVMFDDEHYPCAGGATLTCLCDRCKKSWEQWLGENRPELAVVMPEVFLDDPYGYEEHYNAWWFFRANLVRDWYVAARERFMAAATKAGNQSSRKSWISSYTAPTDMDSIKTHFMNSSEMVGIFDRIMPMFYEEGDEVRKHMREFILAVPKENAYGAVIIGPPSGIRYLWQPGQLKAQLLEIMFAGAKGYICWGWAYSNLRIYAEAAQTNGVVAANEEVFLKGKFIDKFWTEQNLRYATTLETNVAGLLLVSNYTKSANSTVWLRKRPEAALEMTEVYTGKTIKLSAQQQMFSVETAPGTCTLWKWQKPKKVSGI